MRLEFGSPVFCSDGAAGRLGDVVVDPAARRVTHLVVEPHHRHALARLVPVELMGDPDATPGSLSLRCTRAELRSQEPVAEFAYLRLDELPIREAGWDVGVEDVQVPLPLRNDLFGGPAADPDPHAYVSYDRVPKGEVEMRRASAVSSADGRRLGHLEGLVLDGSECITGIVVERRRLWARRRTTVPIDAVDRLGTDAVVLRLGRDDVRALGLRA